MLKNKSHIAEDLKRNITDDVAAAPGALLAATFVNMVHYVHVCLRVRGNHCQHLV
jgi:hypothetical protein